MDAEQWFIYKWVFCLYRKIDFCSFVSFVLGIGTSHVNVYRTGAIRIQLRRRRHGMWRTRGGNPATVENPHSDRRWSGSIGDERCDQDRLSVTRWTYCLRTVSRPSTESPIMANRNDREHVVPLGPRSNARLQT